MTRARGRRPRGARLRGRLRPARGGRHRPDPGVRHRAADRRADARGPHGADDDERPQALARTAVVKLNGGLGTSMGLVRAEVGAGGARRADLPRRHGPAGARAARAVRRAGPAGPDELVPHPRAVARGARPATPTSRSTGCRWTSCRTPSPSCAPTTSPRSSWPDDPDLEWCPPGHGDVYVALAASGVLEALRDKGFRYAFLSNSDNLGATCDPAIPAWMARESHPLRRPRSASGPSTTARAATSRCAGATAGSCCASSAMVAPRARSTTSRTPTGTRCSTPTTCGSTSTPWPSSWPPATASSACRSSSTARPSTRAARTRPRSSRSSRPWARRSRCSTARAALHVPRSRFRPVKTTNELLLLRSDLYGFGDGTGRRARPTGPTPASTSTATTR